jgi:hypothetical protein
MYNVLLPTERWSLVFLSPSHALMAFKYSGKTIVAALLLTTTLSSCHDGEKAPDVSGIKVTLNSARFDLDYYAIDTNHVSDGLKKLAEKYPDFLNYYLDTLREYNIHGNFSDTTDGVRNGVRTDLTFKDFVHLQDTIRLIFPNSKETDQMLSNGFRYMKYYFPEYKVPRIIYLNMELSKWPSFPMDSTTICIGLDMFLGDDFPYRAYIGLPDYTIAHRRKSYLPVSVFSTIYKMAHPFQPEDRTLLDAMLQRGREYYYLHKVLPGTPDSVIFGFTQKQLDWCTANEGLIYNFFIHGNLLYNHEMMNVMAYVTDGPFAKGIEDPNDEVKYSPGNIGSWTGYRIVSAWMHEHPKTTLSQLVNQTDNPDKILGEANYRPK